MKRVLLTVLLAVWVSPASAALIYLKDGSRIRGTVVGATARDVRVHTDSGTQTITSDRILRIDYSESEPIPETESTIPRRHVPTRSQRTEPSDENNQMISIGFGFANPLSRVDFSAAGGGSSDNGDTGLLIGTQYHYFVHPQFGVGLNLEYMNRGRNGSQSLVPATNTDVYGNSLLIMGTVRYSPTRRGSVRPYLMAGLGTNRTSTIADATPNSGFAWSDTDTAETRTLIDDARWGLATTARLGIDFLLADPALFSLEFGWTGLQNSDATATPAGRDLGLEKVKGDLNIMTIAARWGWRF